MTEEQTKLIFNLRRQLHSIPEASMHELRTRRALMDFIARHAPSLEISDRGSWFYAVKKGAGAGSPVAFRADFDAVVCPDGVARHLCGHDGHSASLAAFALWLDSARPKHDVYLIFQPGEETGQGGMMCASLIDEKHIGEIYGFHNIPGRALGSLVLLERTFACASTGLEISFAGRQSHAAYPEAGANPAGAIAELILAMNEAVSGDHRGVLLGTVIGIECGSRSYGVSAGQGVLRLTLRAERQDEYDALVSGIEQTAEQLARRDGLECRLSRIEEFPATVNDPACVRRVADAARELGLEVVRPAEPMRWSEDFGHYLQKTRGAFFGIGCGESHPALHTAGYEFEDGVIPTALEVFKRLVR